MPEVAHSGEQHGEAGLVGGGDHFVVADRAAGLDHRGRAGFGRREQPVGEGEEGVRRDR